MQKVIIYSQTGEQRLPVQRNVMRNRCCGGRVPLYDAEFYHNENLTVYYQNEHSYSIQPNESVLLLLQSNNDNWLRHGLTYEIKFTENQFKVTPNKRPYQL